MLSNWAAFVWLWRNDPEARWYWLYVFITIQPGDTKTIQRCVVDNLYTFGLTRHG